MEQKHTPGPWAERGWSVTGPTAVADYVAIMSVKEGVAGVFTAPVAQTRGKSVICTAYGMSQEEATANARLLGAAPELLEALQACYAALHPHSDEGRVARAAIAKATGSAT